MGGCLGRTWLAQKTMGCGREGLAWMGRGLSFLKIKKINEQKRGGWLGGERTRFFLSSKNLNEQKIYEDLASDSFL